jgi:hypothetical protein
MISVQRLIPFVIVLLVLYGLVRLFRFAQQYDPGAERLAAGGAPEVSLLFEDATIVSRTRGITEWTLPVDRIEVRSPMYGGLDSYSSVDFRGIKNGKLYRAGKLEATVSAQSALYEQQSGSFTIGGPLRLVSVDNDRLDAESCIWTERNDEVRLGKGVRAVVQGHSLRSPFVLFSPRKRIVNCPQGAEGVFDTQTLRASNLVWDINRSLVECRGPVSGESAGRSWFAQSARMELTGERTGSDRQTEKQTRVKQLIANDVNMQLRIEGEDFGLGASR